MINHNEEYYPRSRGDIRDQLLRDWDRSREVTIRREDFDYILATLRTASTYCHRDAMVEAATLHISQRAAIKVLEQYA